MDIESDDSERWEDFFGSSTELAPSLLGIYDNLTSSFDVKHSHSGLGSDSSSTNTTANSTANTSIASGNHNGSANSSSRNNNHSTDDDDDIDAEPTSENSRRQTPVSGKATTTHNHKEDLHPEPLLSESVQEAHHPAKRVPPSSEPANRRSLTFTHGKRAGSQSLSTLSLTGNGVSERNGNGSSSSASSSNLNKSRETYSSASSIASKHRSNIRVLSPNVQRIITHSDAEHVDSVDIDAIQLANSSPALSATDSPPQQHWCGKKTTTNGGGLQHKVKLSHIPLSKTTGKLTQAGNELVETFDSSSEYLDALGYPGAEKASAARCLPYKPPTPAILHIPGTEDPQKTPTNSSPFTFDRGVLGQKPRKLTLASNDSVESFNLIEMEKLATTTSQLMNASAGNKTEVDGGRVTKEFVATEPLSPTEIVETINYTLIEKTLTAEVKFGDKQKEPDKTGSPTSPLIQTLNKPVINKSLMRSSSAASAATVAGSRLLTYARQLHAAKANTLGGPVPLKLPTQQQLEELEEASRISAESLDRLTDIKSKFSPKESRKISSLMLHEINKLKHRPLSSSSICSTSSSSSSGSDQLNGKLATSYLASVESLADQSENEDPHSGMSVFERTCMEIVETERSYVVDLGQVIRGYLSDWKERACLSYDELRILFSNIEEIYEFNSTLLKQLINSGMDPVKIAKCFIELRESFDVLYTTYCTSYPEAISLLTKLLQAKHTNTLLSSTQKMLHHTLPLGSYLLKPVQRILKYHLLLDNLRKHCDVKEVFQAYEIMRQVARNIDQVKRKLEQQSRVKELSGILDGWLGPDLSVLGELRQEGLLMEHNKPRMVFLFGTMLIITKAKEDNRLQFKSYIHQNNLMLSEHLPGEPTSFYVIPYDDPRSQIKLTAKNRDQKRLWAQHIKGVILEKFDNIPNRAKELVYKLGDEEDRTPDKLPRKWSLHSGSNQTPTYLERRNQYRRSEMRNRSKFKRKTITNSTSFDCFNESAEMAAADTKSVQLTRNNSMDDNMLPALQKIAAAVRSKGKAEAPQEDPQEQAEDEAKNQSSGDLTLCDCREYKKNCVCVLREGRSSAKSASFSATLKKRSKSVPRISFHTEELIVESTGSLHGSNSNLDERKSKSTKSIEVKQYNHKTIPKRIATLKKQRSSKKETSKFYMDLEDFQEPPQTVLHITESTENLSERKEAEGGSGSPNADDANGSNNERDSGIEEKSDTTLAPAKKDAQIVLDLLKNSKDFEKLGRKPQRKRSEAGLSAPTSPEPHLGPILAYLPPRPPSRSPPPLELEDKTPTKVATEEEEPIYESLLRNVHVPYKFSPIMSRSTNSTSTTTTTTSTTSCQYYKPREKKATPPPPRPESDYVTLVYNAEGALQQVGDDVLPSPKRDSGAQQEQRDSCSSNSSSSTVKRDSQSTLVNFESVSTGNISQISYAASSANEVIYARPMPKNLMKRLLSSTASTKSSQESVAASEASLAPPRARKSIDSISLNFGWSHKPLERRTSDVSEMCRQSILHRQGSEAVGERMAHVDYADPRTLFNLTAPSEASLQRDSVFSLTSSNDSVCEQKRANGTNPSELSTNFEYEDNVEACLENDFRDSAIYSDDNEKRPDSEISDFGDAKQPQLASPTTPTRSSTHPKVPPKPSKLPTKKIVMSPPPPLPPHNYERVFAHDGSTGLIICPPNMSAAASRSWVLQQIENFNK